MFPNISLADLWKLIVGVKKVVREEQREHWIGKIRTNGGFSMGHKEYVLISKQPQEYYSMELFTYPRCDLGMLETQLFLEL
jgi:5-bromo-4-chloroindolyl phosphate hydrolysis protein